MVREYDVEVRTIWTGSDDTLVLEGAQKILDSQVQGGRRVDIVVGTPIHRCRAEREDGEPCQRQVSGPDERCHDHA